MDVATRSARAVFALVLVAAICGCGASPRKSLPLSSWLSFRASDKTANLRLTAAYNDAYNGFNFNGYAKGQVLIEIPQGWRVEVRCLNHSQDMRHSCAVVRGLGATPAFTGAASPSPTGGLSPGGAATFSFVAARPGSYRIVCLVPGHEQAGMWNALDVTRARLPAVVLLRRSP